jgi:uncharacterized ParB-like nuclease family protein
MRAGRCQQIESETMKSNLENIPAALRVIARQIERGEIAADVGVLTLRKKGSGRPAVFGFGAADKLNPVSECGRAAVEILRLQGVPPASREQTDKAIKALNKIAS